MLGVSGSVGHPGSRFQRSTLARDATGQEAIPTRSASGGHANQPATEDFEDKFSWPECAFFLPVLIVSAGSFFTLHGYNALPAETVLELVFVVATVGVLRRIHPLAAIVALTAATFVFFKFLAMEAFHPAGAYDFIQGYKAYIYVVPLCFFVGKNLFSGPRLARVVDVLLVIFLAKYSAASFIGHVTRPGVFAENNFELFTLLGWFYLAHPYFRSHRTIRLTILVFIVLISRSRVSIIEFLVLYLFLYVRPGFKYAGVRIAGIGILAYGAFTVFTFRLGQSGGLQHLDRLHFLRIFNGETAHWGLLEWLVGSPPLTPLSPPSCQDLSYYTALFSHSYAGECYSVILHAFVLRVIFDQGLLGLLLLIALTTASLHLSAVPNRDRWALYAITAINAASVASLNSIFVTLVLAVALGLDRSGSPEARSDGSRSGRALQLTGLAPLARASTTRVHQAGTRHLLEAGLAEERT